MPGGMDKPRRPPRSLLPRAFMRRRPPISAVVTVTALVGTVIAVYAIFPRRDHELVSVATARHRDPGPLGLERPTAEELRRPVALVRYRFGDQAVTVLAQRARDAPPRTFSRRDGDDYAVSWRRGGFTFVAVGPADEIEAWKPLVGAP
jgi:hypothetical protein